MRAASLRHRVSIQTESSSVDTYGEPTHSWSTDETVWAMVEPVSGNEQSVGEGQSSIITHRVMMRYTANATPKKRLLFGSKILGIESVINDLERNEFLILQCKQEFN
tara:strand:+ start:7904 stop:8224 length:321 start_codon:yes stop_codon:yes gene_type:complete